MLWVFLGGGFGAVLRYIVSEYINKQNIIPSFTPGTFIVNLTGCFLFGILAALFFDNPLLKLLFLSGFCGGYTTFSTFADEIINIEDKKLAVFYILSSVICGIAAVYAGVKIPSFFS